MGVWWSGEECAEASQASQAGVSARESVGGEGGGKGRELELGNLWEERRGGHSAAVHHNLW